MPMTEEQIQAKMAERAAASEAFHSQEAPASHDAYLRTIGRDAPAGAGYGRPSPAPTPEDDAIGNLQRRKALLDEYGK